MQDNSRKYDIISIKVNIFDRFMGNIRHLMLKLPKIYENMHEEGSELQFGSKEEINVFWTLLKCTPYTT